MLVEPGEGPFCIGARLGLRRSPATEVAQQLEHEAQLLDGLGVTRLGVEVHDVVADEAQFVQALDESGELPRVLRTCEFAVILRGCLHFPVLVHDLLRGPVSECGVETLPIVAQLDVACDVFACFPPCRVGGPVNPLDFESPIE
jgi:hypothetical protein